MAFSRPSPRECATASVWIRSMRIGAGACGNISTACPILWRSAMRLFRALAAASVLLLLSGCCCVTIPLPGPRRRVVRTGPRPFRAIPQAPIRR